MVRVSCRGPVASRISFRPAWSNAHTPGIYIKTKAIHRHDVLEKITIDGSERNAGVVWRYNEALGMTIVGCQVKYLNYWVEQDHRTVTRVTHSMLGFRAFDAA